MESGERVFDKEDIKYRLNEKVLECRWPKGLVEKYKIEFNTLTGSANSRISGISHDDKISWNTGNIWLRHGNANINFKNICFTFGYIF